MSTFTPTYDKALGGNAIERDARALLGQVMGFVAVTLGFAALGAVGLLFGLGLLLGLAVAPVITDYANADPSVLWQAAGATAAFVAALGTYGYATRRDLSAWVRPCSGRCSA